jgi:hypothetical protein
MLAASENGPRGTSVNVSMPQSHHTPLTFPLATALASSPAVPLIYKAWMPHSCRANDMKAASMSFGPDADGAGVTKVRFQSYRTAFNRGIKHSRREVTLTANVPVTQVSGGTEVRSTLRSALLRLAFRGLG